MSELDQVFDFITSIYDGLSGVFLSKWPFNVFFVLGLVFLVVTVAISFVHVFSSIGGRNGSVFRWRGGNGIKGPNLDSGAGHFNSRFRRARGRRKGKKRFGTQVNYITNVYDSNGEKINSKFSSNEE